MTKPSKLSAPIRDANDEGRLGLILYAIPGYPSPQAYLDFQDAVDDNNRVSILETAIPVSTGFSSHANETIRTAHLTATKDKDGLALFRELRRSSTPSLLVLYEAVLGSRSYEEMLELTCDHYEGLLLEWDEPDSTPYLEPSRNHNVELVQCVGPWMSEERIAEIVRQSDPGGLVYLMSAPMTGGELFSPEKLSECIATTRKYRSDVVFAAGFGIRRGSDVTKLKKVEGLHAVIVGTALLEAMGKEMSSAQALVDELCGAL